MPSSVTEEDDWVTLSEVEHWLYCPRQWAIIQLEQYFIDNDETMRGHLAHRRVDQIGHETRREATTLWSVDVVSEQHRIRGRCDRVLLKDNKVIPVEHKSGAQHHRAFEMQLVGQAVCLEEMCEAPVSRGRLYFVATNTYLDIEVGEASARSALFDALAAIRAARANARRMPAPANDDRCVRCSFIDVCLPSLVSDYERQTALHWQLPWL